MLREIPFAPAFPRLPDIAIPLAEAATARAAHQNAPDNPARVPGFRMTDPRAGWGIVTALRDLADRRDDSFCEWGAGLGLVAGLAALAGWRARGIELESVLVAEGQAMLRALALDVDLSVGSYKPAGFFDGPAPADLPPAAPGLCDSAVTFVYAWPAEMEAVRRFFERKAPSGSYLLLYRGGVSMSLWLQD